MLMPLFLWGFLLAGGEAAVHLIDAGFWLVFFVIHIPFYGGSTALNSYYDRDEGPVGGLWNPPKVTRQLWTFAVGLQVLGLILMFFISRPIFYLSLIMGAMSTAYSHPATRLKARPWASLLMISFFQGMGGTAAGWLFVQGDWSSLLALKPLAGLLSAALVITGFYPLTQVYQRAEDRRQGVISFAVYAGERTFALSIASLLSAAAVMAALSWRYLGHLEAFLVGLSLVGQAGLVGLWWLEYDDEQVQRNYRWMMRLGYLMTAGFFGFILWQLLQGL
jgi:4-hydroxybenzoate polyprenyltransferase